jgi:pimeloyl-ACP methyl ester carboxylesterase
MGSRQNATRSAQRASKTISGLPGDDDDRKQTFEHARRELFARYGFEAEGRRVADREGRSTYLLSRGEDARPIVLVHGGLSHAGEWAPLAGQIPGRVIIPDRPGCGLSYPIDYRGVDYRKAAADWLLDLLAGIDARQVDLVGGSMGGFFSIAFALAHPDRVRRLVLVGAPAGLDKPLPLFLRLWGNAITGPLIRRLKITDAETLRNRVYGPLLVAHPEDVPLELLEMGIAAAALPGVDRASYTMLRAVTTLRGFRRSLMVREELGGLGVPSLFLWGDSDAFALPSSGRDMVASMREAAIEVIPNTGHLPHLERPDAVAAALIHFLTGDADGAPLAATSRRSTRHET